MWGVLSQTFREFLEDECPRLAAALAFYTFFALPALLVVIVYIAGLLLAEQVDQTTIASRLKGHFEETIGPEGAEQITKIVENVRKATHPKHSGSGVIVGSLMLLLGASGALQELQSALNRAWRVEPDPAKGGVRQFLLKRLLSLVLLLGIAVLLIASVMIGLGLAKFGVWIDAHHTDWLSSRFIGWLHTGLSLVIYTILFAALFRFVPDAKVDWSDVWLGAITTTLLFWIGQWALGVYLAWSKPTSAYGAAGSLALVLLWMYYSAMIFFFGAEFTHVLAKRGGKPIVPIRGARVADSQAASAPKAL